MRRLLLLVGLIAALGCRPTAATTAAPGEGAGDVPIGPLPRNVLPVGYTLELEIVPARERFSGRTQIAVTVQEPTARIWLHGKKLAVRSARVIAGQTAIAATYREVDDSGVARLDLDASVPRGPARIELEYDAPLGKKLGGLYAVESGGERYAFTQFEPLEARAAFPGFDEPAFKTPFDIWLTVPIEHTAITNTPQVGFQPVPGGLKRLRFATTKPLPTYLIGFSVGPFDVVEGEPIAPSPQRPTPLPLRGVAVKGAGPRLAHALAHTGPLLLELERYYDIAYPYAKLDLIAVPDFGAGAMENAAAITFREWLLLLDDSATESQRRAFASVMAHELAHHWFGNLVTMPWWDDIWLNEGFATWSGQRTVEAVHPEHGAAISLARSVQHVMNSDSRRSARVVRQPVATNRDMGNAFDGITYQKGAGVLRMFERYLGEEVFRKGVQTYLRERAFDVGASPDLLETLGRVAGRPVAPAFNSFLQQVGVPLLQVSVACGEGGVELSLRQSRYLPLGSQGSREQQWQLPVCVRYGQEGGEPGEHCTLLTEAEGVSGWQGACPTWLMPNADGAGYYRWSLSSEWLAKLREHGYGKLSTIEKLSLADSLSAALSSGALDAADVMALFPQLAADERREVAGVPSGLLAFMREHVVDDAHRGKLELFARELYGARFARLGFAERKGEDGEARLLRGELAWFMAEVARDTHLRSRLAELGRAYLGGPGEPLQPTAVAPDLRRGALVIALRDGDGALWDLALTKLKHTRSAGARGDLLGALGSVTREADAARALQLSFDEALRINEVLTPLRYQMGEPATRAAAFAFLQERYDALVERAAAGAAGRLPSLGAHYCDAEAARAWQAFFAERAPKLSGGERNLASALESIELCMALVQRQRASVHAFLDAR